MSPPSVDDAEQELRNLAAASSSRPPIEAVVARARSRRTRRRWTAAIAMTVAVCVGVGAVAVARNGSTESPPSVAATAPHPSGASAAGPVRIVVTPATSALDAALRIQVTGLRPGRSATVEVTSRDFKGVEWASRLQAGGQVQPNLFLAYPDAGHGVATLLPHQPARLVPSFEGKTPPANWHAREQTWPRVLDFLANPT